MAPAAAASRTPKHLSKRSPTYYHTQHRLNHHIRTKEEPFWLHQPPSRKKHAAHKQNLRSKHCLVLRHRRSAEEQEWSERIRRQESLFGQQRESYHNRIIVVVTTSRAGRDNQSTVETFGSLLSRPPASPPPVDSSRGTMERADPPPKVVAAVRRETAASRTERKVSSSFHRPGHNYPCWLRQPHHRCHEWRCNCRRRRPEAA
jgi:hypothetical protein